MIPERINGKFKIFVKSLREGELIMCPFLGWEWDGTFEDLKRILRKECIKNGKVVPFAVSVIETNYEIVYHNGVTHPDADSTHTYFLFNDKKLVKSGRKLPDLM